MKTWIAAGAALLLLVSGLISWAVIGGDAPVVTPTPTPVVSPSPTVSPPAASHSLNGDITYPPSLDTVKKQLAATYRLEQEVLIENNRQGGGKHDPAQWHAFSYEYKDTMTTVIATRNEQQRILFEAVYTPKTWGALSDEEMAAARIELYGDRHLLKTVPTTATSSVLTAFKAIDISSLDPLVLTDPLEDPSTFTEVTENAAVLTQSSTRSTWTNADTDEENYLYDDKGENHFDADYDIDFVTEITSHDRFASMNVYVLANLLGDNEYFRNNSADAHYLRWFAAQTTSRDLTLTEMVAATRYTDDTMSLTVGQDYYVSVLRDDDAGSFGSLTAFIWSDAIDGGNATDTLSVTLHEQANFQYLYMAQGRDDVNGDRNITGWVQNMDLHEAAAGNVTGQIF